MRDDIRKAAFLREQDSSIFEKTLKEFEGISVNTSFDEEVEVEEVETNDPIIGKFRQNTQTDQRSEVKTGNEHIRARPFAKDDVEIEESEGWKRSQMLENVRNKIGQISSANESMKEKGVRRRYVLTKSDVPENVPSFEDSLGIYYYKTLDPISPSDAFEKYSEIENLDPIEDTWFDVDVGDRHLVGLLALAKMYPWAVQELEKEDDVRKFLKDALVTTHDLMGADFDEAFRTEIFERMVEEF